MSPSTLDSTLAASESQGLGASAVRSLCFLTRHSDQTIIIRDLKEHLGLTTAAVTGITDALFKKHLITRDPHPEDRRKLIIAITPAGTTALQSILTAKPTPSVP